MGESFSRNILLLQITGFLRGLVFFLPILALYLEQQVISISGVALIFAIGSVTAIVFEVPSGAFSDIFGRRSTLIVAGLLLLLSVVALGIGGSFAVLAIYAVLNGLAESLFSGTDSSLAYDSLAQEGKEHLFKRYTAISSALWPLGASISSLAGGFLAASSFHLPIFVTVVPFLAAFLLTFFIREPKVDSGEQDDGIIRHIKSAGLIIARDRTILILTLAGFLFYAFGEVAHQLKPIFFEFKSIPIEMFGVIFASTFALSALGSLSAEWVSSRIGDKAVLVLSATIPPLLVFWATFLTGAWVAVLVILSSLFWGLQWPVMSHLVNSVIPSRQRTTILSIGNLANRLGFAAFAILFGLLADATSINVTYQAAALLSFAPAILLYLAIASAPRSTK